MFSGTPDTLSALLCNKLLFCSNVKLVSTHKMCLLLLLLLLPPWSTMAQSQQLCTLAQVLGHFFNNGTCMLQGQL